ncbi:MAG: hypothetical protein AAGG51_10970 [Cyanobacteria bacterium P01_G01_bin.54]
MDFFTQKQPCLVEVEEQMNTPLVQSLLQVILALPEPERHWLATQLSRHSSSLALVPHTMTPQAPSPAIHLIGFAATEAPPPTDSEVKALLEERRTNRYLA